MSHLYIIFQERIITGVGKLNFNALLTFNNKPNFSVILIFCKQYASTYSSLTPLLCEQIKQTEIIVNYK